MADLKTQYKRDDTFVRRWAALVILIAFFILSWGGQLLFQLQVEQQQAEQHGQAFSMQEFWPQFWASTFENWQSEWLQLATQAVLIAALADYIFRTGNRDHYKTQLMIEDLQKDVQNLKKKR
jgi:hypothetical protein